MRSDLAQKKAILLDGESAGFLERNSVSTFLMTRVYDDNSCNLVSNSGEVVDFIFNEKIHIVAHIPEHLVKEQFWYVVPGYEKVREFYQQRFKTSTFFDFIDRTSNYFDMFYFGHVQPLGPAINDFLCQRENFESFSFQLRDRISSAMGKHSNHNILLPSEMAANIHGLQYDQEPTVSKHIARADDQTDKRKNLVTLLSKRELECASLYVSGMSAVQTGNILGLSRRTVEFYFENIKNKLGLFSKRDLFEHADLLQSLRK